MKRPTSIFARPPNKISFCPKHQPPELRSYSSEPPGFNQYFVECSSAFDINLRINGYQTNAKIGHYKDGEGLFLGKERRLRNLQLKISRRTFMFHSLLCYKHLPSHLFSWTFFSFSVISSLQTGVIILSSSWPSPIPMISTIKVTMPTIERSLYFFLPGLRFTTTPCPLVIAFRINYSLTVFSSRN